MIGHLPGLPRYHPGGSTNTLRFGGRLPSHNKFYDTHDNTHPMTHTGGIELNIGRFFFLDRSPSGGTPVPRNGDTGGVSVKSTECVEGHEVMDEDKTSDT